MWPFDCDLDSFEARRVLVIYSAALAPIILSLYLFYKNKMEKWISLTLISTFLIAALGWEVWINYGILNGQEVNLRRSNALSCAIPMNINWIVNSLGDTGIVWFGIILVGWIFRNSENFDKFYWSVFLVLFVWFMFQNILVEIVIYHHQVGGNALLSWAPMMPFGSWFNPKLQLIGDRSVALQTQSAWIIGSFVFYYVSIYFHRSIKKKI